MNIKKIIALMLTALMLAGLCACGGVDVTDRTRGTESTVNTPESISANATEEPSPTEVPVEVTDAPDDEQPTENDAQPTNAPVPTPTAAPEYKVRQAEWADVQWTQYQNVYFTLTIPVGWKVEWQGNAQQLFWRAVSPDGKTGISNLDHRYAAKDYSMMQMLNVDTYLAYGTVREFFETIYQNSTEYFTVQNSLVPSNKAQLQAMRPTTAIRDYQSMYAIFRENGWDGEGLYSAVVMDSPDVYVGGRNYGLWEINCIYTEWTARGDLVNWQPVMTTIAQSFAYTAYYVQEWGAVIGSGTPQSTVSDTDPVVAAFEERSKEDTILQEKRSDMIGEYERVYDNEREGIYRAYNGFLDDIGSDQTRYTPITDSQYADGFVGWIDK